MTRVSVIGADCCAGGFVVVSILVTVDNSLQPVRNGDVIQLIHGMTQRPLNRSVSSLCLLCVYSLCSLCVYSMSLSCCYCLSCHSMVFLRLPVSEEVSGTQLFAVYSNSLACVRDWLACWGTTAATRVPRLRIGECPREVAQEGSTG